MMKRLAGNKLSVQQSTLINHYHQHHHTKMTYFDSSEEWQRQSALLLKARPTTVSPPPFQLLNTCPSAQQQAPTLPTNTHPDTHSDQIPHSQPLIAPAPKETSQARGKAKVQTHRIRCWQRNNTSSTQTTKSLSRTQDF